MSTNRCQNLNHSMEAKRVNTVMGTNQVGDTVTEMAFRAVLSKFKQAGFNELDSSHSYSGGKTLEIIGKCNMDELRVSSKANPWEGNTLKPESLRAQLENSLKACNREKLDIYYLHHPDINVPIEDTLRCINALYEEGKFDEFGLSNYSAWQVAEVCTICKYNNWVRPTVYQGRYNALTRQVEFELLSCLRNYNIRFYAFSPLAAGMLTGKHRFTDINEERAEGRFWNAQWKEIYTDLFWKQEYFEAIEKIRSAIKNCLGDDEAITLTEASLRWLYYHSQLNGEYGDAVVLGFSKVQQLESNLDFVSKGKLHKKIVDAFEQLWNSTMYVGLTDKIDLV